MATTDYLFTQFSRDSRALSEALVRRANQCLATHLSAYTGEQKRTAPAADLVADLISKTRIVPPALGNGIRRVGHTTETTRPTDQQGVTSVVHVFTFTIEMTGDVDWIRYWPDRADADIDPVDLDAGGDDIHAPLPWDEWDPQIALERWELGQLGNRWFLRTEDEHSRLMVRVYVTPEDLAHAADTGEAATTVVHRWIEEVRPIIEATAQQIEEFNERELPAMYTERITDLQRRLRGFDLMFTEVEIPFDRLSQPELSIEPPQDQDGSAETSVVALGPHRLSRASFEDVISTIRVWASGVERYPRAYTQFSEDMLSDTLCVTLNAALPGADREVYRKRGKTDITVRANAVDEGLGPEVVFVCESKIWGGQADVSKNFDQLHGYLDARDTSAVLLYGVRGKDLEHVKREALTALRALDSFQEDSGEISEWPLLRFERNSRRIDLLVAFVHTYDTKTEEPQPTAPEITGATEADRD